MWAGHGLSIELAHASIKSFLRSFLPSCDKFYQAFCCVSRRPGAEANLFTPNITITYPQKYIYQSSTMSTSSLDKTHGLFAAITHGCQLINFNHFSSKVLRESHVLHHHHLNQGSPLNSQKIWNKSIKYQLEWWTGGLFVGAIVECM